MRACVCACAHIVGHHDGEQGLVVGVEGHVKGGGLDHNEEGMEDWGEEATQENINNNNNTKQFTNSKLK